MNVRTAPALPGRVVLTGETERIRRAPMIPGAVVLTWLAPIRTWQTFRPADLPWDQRGPLEVQTFQLGSDRLVWHRIAVGRTRVWPTGATSAMPPGPIGSGDGRTRADTVRASHRAAEGGLFRRLPVEYLI